MLTAIIQSVASAYRFALINKLEHRESRKTGVVARLKNRSAALLPVLCRAMLCLPLFAGLASDAIAQTMSVTISTDVLMINESGDTVSYTVVLDAEPANDVTIAVTSADTTTATVDMSSLTFTTTNWDRVQTVIVTGVSDSPDDSAVSSRMTMISHRIAAGDGAGYMANRDLESITVTVHDPITVTLNREAGTSISEGETLTYTIVLSRALAAGQRLTVPLTFSGTARLNTDYWMEVESAVGVDGGSARFQDINNEILIRFTEDGHTATLTLRVLHDFVSDDGETVILSMGALQAIAGLPGDITLANNAAPLTIGDDSSITASLQVTPTEVPISAFDSGGTTTLTLIPQNVSFLGVIDRPVIGGDGDGEGGLLDDDDEGVLTAAGLALITLTGLSGLTIDSRPWPAIDTSGQYGVPVHRSAELVLSYSGTSVTRATEVTVTVDSELLRRVLTESEARRYRGADLSATFMVTVSAGVSISESDDSTILAEGGGTDTYGVVLNTQPTDNVTITPAATGVTFEPTGLTFTSTDWNEVKTITITGEDDSTDTADREVTVTHTALSDDTRYATSGSLSISDVVATLTDDDPTTVTLTTDHSGAIEEGGTVSFTVALSRTLAAGERIDVPLVIDGTGVSVTDWSLVASGTGVTLLNGDTGTPTLSFEGLGAQTAGMVLTATSDSTAESDTETFSVALGNNADFNNDSDTNVGGGAQPDATDNGFTVQVSDVVPFILSLAIQPGMADEGNTGNFVDAATVTFSLDRERTGSNVLFLVCLTGSAERGAGGDYQFTGLSGAPMLTPANPLCGVASISTGRTSVAYSIRVNGDSTPELDETVIIIVQQSTDAFATPDDVEFSPTASVAIFTIVNDEALEAAGVTVSPSTATVSDDGTATDSYTLVLTSAPLANVTITPDATGVAFEPTGLTFTSTDWNEAKTITITGENDSTDTADRQVTVTHTALSDDTRYATSGSLSISDVVATLTDDDPTIVTLTTDHSGAIEEGGTAGFTVALGRTLAAGERIDVPLVIDGTGVDTEDWSLAASGTGVTLLNGDTGTPTLSFEGLGAQTADLVLTATAEGTDEGGTETFSIALGSDADFNNDSDTNVGGGVRPDAADNSFTLQVSDLFIPYTLSVTIQPVMVDEGNSGDFVNAAVVTFGLDRNRPRSSTILRPNEADVNFAVCFSGSANRGRDYRFFNRDGSNPTLAGPGVGRNCVYANLFGSMRTDVRVIPVNADLDVEPDETIIIALRRSDIDSNDFGTPDDVVISPTAGTATLTIINDDIVPASVTITETGGTTILEEDDGTDTYSMVLTSEPDAEVTITPTATGVTFMPTALTFTTTNWNQVQTITVTGEDDSTDTPDRQVTIEHAVASADDNYSDIEISDVLATLTDVQRTILNLAISPAGNITEAESKQITITLSRSLAAGETLVVPLTFAGTATLVTDYALRASRANGITYTRLDGSGGSPVVTFTGPASETATINLNTVADDMNEGAESLRISVGSLVNVRLSGGVEINNDEVNFDINDPLAISIAGGTAITEGGSASFTVSASYAPTAALIVNLTVADDTDSDFVGSGDEGSRTVTIVANTTTVTFAVVTQDDSVDEANGMVTVTVVSGDGYTRGTPNSATVTVNDNDEASGVTFSESDGNTTLIEDGGTDTYGVVLDTQPTDNVTVTPAAPGVAFEPTALTFTSVNWNEVQTITVTGEDDSIDTPDRQVTIEHAATSADDNYSDIEISDVLATLTDVQATTVTLAGTAGNINEGISRDFTITLGRSLVDNEVLSVQLNLSGTADVGVDYMLTGGTVNGVSYAGLDSSSPVVTFTGRSPTTAATLTLRIVADGAGDPDETITIGLGTLDSSSGISLGGGTTGTDNLADFTVTEGEAIVLGAQSVTIVEEGAGVEYTVQLATIPLDADVTVSLGAPAGLTRNPTSLIFTTENWNMPQTITIAATADDNAVNETRVLEHSASGGGYNGVTADLRVIITDNDEAGVTVDRTTITVVESDGEATYMVVLDTQPGADVEIAVESGDMGTALVSPSVLTFTSTDWDMARTVTVTGVDDAIDNIGDQRIATITHAIMTDVAGGYPASLEIDDVTVTVSDNDTAALTLMPDVVPVQEGAAGTYTVTLATEPSAEVTVTVTGTARAITLSTASLTFSTDNWGEPQTVTVMANEDDNGVSETVTLTHTASNTGGYTAAVTGSVRVNITDSSAPHLIIRPPSLSVTEGSSTSYMVELGTEPTGTVRVTLSGQSGTDVRLDTTSLIFTTSDWDMAQTVTVTALEDADAVTDTMVTLVHRASGADYDLAEDAELEVTIDETDMVELIVRPAELRISEGDAGEYTVVLATEPATTVQVTVDTPSDTDLSLSPTVLTFTVGSWEMVQRVTVTAGQDNDGSNDGPFTLNHRARGGDYDGLTAATEVTVIDDDAAGVTVSPGRLVVTEAGNTDTYAVRLNTIPEDAVSITVRTDDPSVLTVQTAGGVAGGMLTLTFTTDNWSDAQRVTVAGVSDVIDNAGDVRTGTISHDISMDDGGSYTSSLDIGTVFVSVTDDDTAGVRLGENVIRLNEGIGTAATSASYTVMLASQPESTVEITVTSDTTAAAGVNPMTLLFTTTNWNMAQRVTVTAVGDRIDNQPGDLRTARISHAIEAGVGGGYPVELPIGEVVVTVMNDTDEAGLTLLLNGTPADTVSVIEGAASLTYTLALTSEPTADVTVEISGNAGTDLRISPPRITFTTANWNMEHTLVVGAVNDSDTTNDQIMLRYTVATTASNDGYNGLTDTIVATITDTGRTAGVSIGSTAVRITEGQTASYTVVLDAPPGETETVTITVTSSNAGVLTATPATLTFTSTDWSEQRRVTVMAANDDIDNDIERMMSLTHDITSSVSAPTGYGALQARVLDVTITDDADEAGIMLMRGGVPVDAIAAIEGAASLTYTVVLTSAPTADVTLEINGQAGTDLRINPPRITFTTANWNMAHTLMVRAVSDSDTTDDRITLRYTASTVAMDDGYGGLTGTLAATLIDTGRVAGVSISRMTVTVTEAQTASYTVVLDAPPRGTETVTITVTRTGNAAMINPTRLTFTTVNWSEEQRVTVTGASDEIDNDAGRRATLNHAITSSDSSTGRYTALDDRQVSVTVTDDGDEAGVILMRNGAPVRVIAVREDTASLTYTVALTSAPTSDVTIAISGQAGTDLRLSRTRLIFTSTDWNIPQALTVRAVADTDDQPERVILTYAASTTASADGYSGLTGTLQAMIADRDNTTAGVTVRPATLTVAEGSQTTYAIVLDSEPAQVVIISVSPDSEDTAITDAGSVVFTPDDWYLEQIVTITGVDDVLDNPGNRRAVIRHSIIVGGGGYTTGLEIADVQVSVTDDEGPVANPASQEQIAARAAWLPRFGLLAAQHMLDGLNYRFTVTDRPGLSGNLNGLPTSVSASRSMNAGSITGEDSLGAGSVDRMPNISRSLSLRDMLRGSRFVYSDGSGLERGIISVWGQVSYSRYEDAPQAVSVNGDITTGMLGVDKNSGRTLLGLALAYSDGDGDWSGTLETGRLSSTLTSLLPYIRHNVSERLQVWGAASYGEGELEQTAISLDTGLTSEMQIDLKQVSASMGMRGTILKLPVEEGGLTLTLISDATLLRIRSEEADGIMDAQADTRRLRMGLEWSWQLQQADGGRVIPELELGIRYGGGDRRDGYGVELGGGISWELPTTGLTLDLRGRYLLDHEESERREWGLSGSLRYDVQPGSRHGLSLSLRQEYGNTSSASGLDELLSSSLSETPGRNVSKAGAITGRWILKGEWGFTLEDGGTSIPYAGLSSSDTRHDLTLGWLLLSAPGEEWNSELDIKAIHREESRSGTNHGIGAEFKLNWQ